SSGISTKALIMVSSSSFNVGSFAMGSPHYARQLCNYIKLLLYLSLSNEILITQRFLKELE
ncbi:MAG: hypothetical protein ACKOA8_02080, partial [Deltaproteobacteria bacterium]